MKYPVLLNGTASAVPLMLFWQYHGPPRTRVLRAWITPLVVGERLWLVPLESYRSIERKVTSARRHNKITREREGPSRRDPPYGVLDPISSPDISAKPVRLSLKRRHPKPRRRRRRWSPFSGCGRRRRSQFHSTRRSSPSGRGGPQCECALASSRSGPGVAAHPRPR